MDEVNIQNVSENTQNISNEVGESNNVVSDSQLIDNAKRQMYGKDGGKDKDTQTEPKVEPVKAEAPKVEVQKSKEDKLRAKDKEQIGALTRQKYDLKAENARQKKMIEELQAKIANPPKETDFNTTREYDRALVKHELDVENKTTKIEADYSEFQKKAEEEWVAQVRDQVSDFNKFATDYNTHKQYIEEREPVLLNFVNESEVAPQILEVMFNNIYAIPEKKAVWMRMSNTSKQNQLAQLEMAIINKGSMPAPAPAPTRSNAPTPITPEKRTEVISNSEPKNDQELIEQAKRRMYRR